MLSLDCLVFGKLELSSTRVLMHLVNQPCPCGHVGNDVLFLTTLGAIGDGLSSQDLYPRL